jgi:hypothetical protein
MDSKESLRIVEKKNSCEGEIKRSVEDIGRGVVEKLKGEWWLMLNKSTLRVDKQ